MGKGVTFFFVSKLVSYFIPPRLMTKRHIDPVAEQQFLSAYDDYADAIFRHCALRLGNREIGKELMQETFLRAWESMMHGTTIQQPRAFLYKIANNLIIDFARRRKLRTEQSLEDMFENTGFDVPDKEPGPARVTEGKLALSMLQQLEEPYRSAIIMRYVDDMPPNGMAKVLGVSPNVVSVRIHRGLAKLASLMRVPQSTVSK